MARAGCRGGQSRLRFGAPFAVISSLAIGSFGAAGCSVGIILGGSLGTAPDDDAGAFGASDGGPAGPGEGGAIDASMVGRDASTGSVPVDAGTDAAGLSTVVPPPVASYLSAPPPLPPQGNGDPPPASLWIHDTDVYRVAGNRLYYASPFRGLLVFDVSNVDHPVLLGSSAMSGDPQALYVNGNVVTAVFANTYGADAQGAPFHGSDVRVVDCTDPTSIKVLGDVEVDGYVQDSNLVGNILYTVGTDRGDYYGEGWGVPLRTVTPRAIVTSIRVAAGAVSKIAEQSVPGDNTVFAFGTGAILVATSPTSVQFGGGSTVYYADASDTSGALTMRGSMTLGGQVGGTLNGSCLNTRGWAVDFSDGVHAHAVVTSTNGATGVTTFSVVTVDFSSPDTPNVASTVQLPDIAAYGNGAVPRFAKGSTGGLRLYIAHTSNQGSMGNALDIYDLSNPALPLRVGATTYVGEVCSILPVSDQLFSISSFTDTNNASGINVEQIDVTNAAAPKILGSAMVQAGRDVFPAAEASRAINLDSAGDLAVAPVTINETSGPYTNGVRVLRVGSATLGPSGMGVTQDRIVNSFFVQNRVYALTDENLTIFDVTTPAMPRQSGQLAFAPEVLAVQPVGSSIVELSSDPELPKQVTDVRLVAAAGAGDPARWSAATGAQTTGAQVPSWMPEVFANGSLLYVSTNDWANPNGTAYSQQISVVDTSTGSPVNRGSVPLPTFAPTPAEGTQQAYYSAYSFAWYTGPDIVQAASTVLVVHHANDPLRVVDVSNPDAPAVTNAPVMLPSTLWTGNLQVLGGDVYITTIESMGTTCPMAPTQPTTGCVVALYVAKVDVHDPAHPSVGPRISVPGIPFGASKGDPTIVYFSGYTWDAQTSNEHTVLFAGKVSGDQCDKQASLAFNGLSDVPLVQNDQVFTTVDLDPGTELHEVDFTNPVSPADHLMNNSLSAWGTLKAISGDEVLLGSGWSNVIVDVYRLNGSAPATYQATIPNAVWGRGMLAQSGSSLYVAAGVWGVETLPAQ